MEAIDIDKICIALLNKRVNRLKENIEYLNEDGSLDVYTHVEAILNDTKDSPTEKLQFFYDKLFGFYGRKKPAGIQGFKKAA
ncbi:MAG: hypothetical protein EVJ48_01655 [Candidatus Acidulodesulfobacterium acidiphilum]|uniref:Uncharacterized protein n=1 Tax=Candidatus Acidulodesulfobacterium acidiphilum TaxID=2597224 RepID=A0A520XGB4_9DELT|nr:MAG: hypothetical protein EVJ48_01655 [Candidatus Acidulodesulfobacterium acidiphilum]